MLRIMENLKLCRLRQLKLQEEKWKISGFLPDAGCYTEGGSRTGETVYG